MFVEQLYKSNQSLIDITLKLHREGSILPDSYIIDVDMFIENARMILAQATKYNISLYFMLKQVGRNPYLAKKLVELGYQGAVVVDYKEALLMMQHQIPISNVGHLVQVPTHLISKLVDYNCEYFTVYSMEKVHEINQAAKANNKIQKILLKVYGDEDLLYSGQESGFPLEQLEECLDEIQTLTHVQVKGATAFPCFQLCESTMENIPTNNLFSVLKAIEIMRAKGIAVDNINLPSTTSVSTMKSLALYGATSAEPGHGLSGTTPYHQYSSEYEKIAVLYLSEISHNFKNRAYCYGGGHYRRSHVKNALVGAKLKKEIVTPVNDDSIDYYFSLGNSAMIGDPVIMCFRFQMFVTRSDVVLVEGVSSDAAKVVGIYDGLGQGLQR